MKSENKHNEQVTTIVREIGLAKIDIAFLKMENRKLKRLLKKKEIEIENLKSDRTMLLEQISKLL